MIEVKIPKDVMEFKEKLFLDLTARQIIFSAIALLVCVPTYLFGKKYLSEDFISIVVLFLAIPILAFGFFNKNSMSFEQWIVKAYSANFNPQKRTYIDLPVIWTAREQIVAEELQKEEILKIIKKKEERSAKRAIKARKFI